MPNSSIPKIETLLPRLRLDYPAISFVEATRFSWHAGDCRVCYKRTEDIQGTYALIHELGHGLLDHTDYRSDIELLQIEVAAWEKAREIAEHYGFVIDEDYIQDALDSYRDWLHLRSTCPNCYERCLQHDRHTYHCHNCGSEWHVSRSRLCRPYRTRRGFHLLSVPK